MVKAVEFMLVEALMQARHQRLILGTDQKLLTLVEAINDPEAFSRLNDSIVDLILNCAAPEIVAAQKLLRQVQARAIYSCVGRVNMPDDMVDQLLGPYDDSRPTEVRVVIWVLMCS